MTVREARRIPDMEPGSGEWLSMMTASKVAALLGLSPWESRYSLYYRLAGQLPHKEGTVNTERGHYLEDAVVQWWADQRTDLRVGKTGTWANKARPWQAATPDRLVFEGRRAVGVLEAKTSGDYDHWGPDGSDIIPDYYRPQVVWQMDCLGLPTGHLAVLLPRLTFRSYVIHYDRGEAQWIRREARAFLDSLPGGPAECPPDIDQHDATYEAIRRLHPEMDDRDVEIDLDLAARFVGTIRDSAEIQAAETAVKSELALAMGTATRAVLPRPGSDPVVIARRQAKGSGTPFVVVKRPLPSLENL